MVSAVGHAVVILCVGLEGIIETISVYRRFKACVPEPYTLMIFCGLVIGSLEVKRT